MEKFSYANTFSKDLFAILNAEAKDAGVLDANVDLQKFMEPWLTRYDKIKTCLFISCQSKFYLTGPASRLYH